MSNKKKGCCYWLCKCFNPKQETHHKKENEATIRNSSIIDNHANAHAHVQNPTAITNINRAEKNSKIISLPISKYNKNQHNYNSTIVTKIGVPSLASSTFFGFPHRSSMMRLLSAALRSCSFFNSSAAFFLRSNWRRKKIKLISFVQIFAKTIFSSDRT